MTDESKKQNIQEELTRAADFLKASEILFNNDLINDAVSRLYYFVLFNIRALLLSKELEPKSHEGALRLFAQHFVRENIFRAQSSHIFSKLMKYREEADYNPFYSFTVDDYTEFRKEAEQLAAEVQRYLEKTGFSISA